jgi:hypothetical protein
MRLVATVLSALLSGLAAGPAAAPRATPAVLALQQYFGSLKTIRASAGGRPLTMLLDTGGGATLITPDVARQLGCTPFGRDVGHRMSGEAVEFQQCRSLVMSAGGWQHRVEPVGVFDVNRLLPEELPRLDGVLALDAFRGEVVTLDWAAATLTVHGRTDGEAAVRKSGVPVRIATGDGGRFYSALVPVSASRAMLWFLIDSGNIRGTLVARHVVRDGLLDVGADGNAKLSIGSRPAISLPTEAADLIIDGALGTAYLLRGPVTLDLRGPS